MGKRKKKKWGKFGKQESLPYFSKKEKGKNEEKLWEDRIGAIHKVTAGVSTSSSLFVLSLKENRSEEDGKKNHTKKNRSEEDDEVKKHPKHRSEEDDKLESIQKKMFHTN